jgi:hypothetical protein
MSDETKKGELPLAAMAQVVDAMPQEVAILNKEMEIVYMNKAKRLAFSEKWASAPVEGRKCFECFEGYSQPCNACPVEAMFRTRRAFHTVTETRRMGRNSFISVTTAPLLSEAGDLVGAVEIVEDITPRVKTESLKLALAAARSRDEIVHQTIRSIAQLVGCDRCFIYRWSSSVGRAGSGREARVKDGHPMAFKTLSEHKLQEGDGALMERVCADHVAYIRLGDCHNRSLWPIGAEEQPHGLLLCGLPEDLDEAHVIAFPLDAAPDEMVIGIAQQAAVLATDALRSSGEPDKPPESGEEETFSCPVCPKPCLLPRRTDPTSVYVALGEGVDDENLFAYCIAPAVAACGRKAYRNAPGEPDSLCAICAAIRTSPLAIVDVSAWSGSTLLKLGMIYGFGREAVLIKRRDAQVPVDLQGMEYLAYDEFAALGRDLGSRLSSLRVGPHGRQLRDRCFKFGARCHHDEVVLEDTVFIGMPFRAETENVYTAVIRPTLRARGLHPWKADEEPRMIDLMCKVCQGIQSSKGAIINLTGWNPNVLFELGLAFALRKHVFIMRKESDVVADRLEGLNETVYSDFRQLRKEIEIWLPDVTRNC